MQCSEAQHLLSQCLSVCLSVYPKQFKMSKYALHRMRPNFAIPTQTSALKRGTSPVDSENWTSNQQ